MVIMQSMRNLPIELIKNYFRDRTMLGFTILLLLLGVAYIIFVAVALEPSDLQVATRYTAFGDAHLAYRSKWYYLLSFVVFGALLITVHTAIAVKLHSRGQRYLAMYWLACTALLFMIGWIITRSVLQIAFL